jgi:hypothetical protein
MLCRVSLVAALGAWLSERRGAELGARVMGHVFSWIAS